MAVGKVTTFKVDEKTMGLVSEIGEMTGAKNGHEAMRAGLRLGWLVLQHRKLRASRKRGPSLEEYLNTVAGAL